MTLRRCLLVCALVCLGSPAWAQRGLPNPLIQPPGRMVNPAEGGAPEGAPPAAPSAPSGTLKDIAGKGFDDVPTELLGRVSALYVSAIVGDVAVLRAASAAGSAPAAGGAGSAAGAAATPAGGAGRAVVYYVRDSEPFQIFDRFRLLPKVQDTTVVLYLLPDSSGDTSKRPQIVFRSSLDSLQSVPHVPAKLEAAGESAAYQGLIQTGAGGNSGSGKGVGSAGGSK